MGRSVGNGVAFSQMLEDFGDHLGLGDESDESQLAPTVGTDQGVGKVDTPDEVSPSSSQRGPFLRRHGGVGWIGGGAVIGGCLEAEVRLGMRGAGS